MAVYGTRPEAIKIAPLIKALDKDSRFDTITVSTGQHREILDQVNSMFNILPAYDLNLMGQAQGLSELVSLALAGLDKIIASEKPDVIISQGDTSTAMSAALAGFHRQIKVAHLEAGLRTDNIRSPFPEEANRRIIGQVSDLHLAPTSSAKKNLLTENFNLHNIVVVGNTVIDALLEASTWDTHFSDPRLDKVIASQKRIVLVTTHRRENLSTMSQIASAVKDLAEAYKGVNFVLPLHPNPLVRSVVLPRVKMLSNVIITDPLPYDEFTKLMGLSTLVLTDSGGIQEEAPALGKPVLCMRENTERPEAIEAGTVKLVGTNRNRIFTETSLLLDNPSLYDQVASAVNPYGDGKAAERSVAAIAQLLGVGERLPDFEPSHMDDSTQPDSFGAFSH